jgi:hypothetical protein
MDDEYDCALSVLCAAKVVIEGEGMKSEAMLPVLADFTAALALSIGGEETLQLAVDRMLLLVDDWKLGKSRTQHHRFCEVGNEIAAAAPTL